MVFGVLLSRTPPYLILMEEIDHVATGKPGGCTDLNLAA